MSAVLYDEPGPQARRRIMLGSVVGAVVLAAGLVWLVLKLASEGIFDGDRWDVFSDAVVWESFAQGMVGHRARRRRVAGVLALLLGRRSRGLAAWRRTPSCGAVGTIVVELLRGMPAADPDPVPAARLRPDELPGPGRWDSPSTTARSSPRSCAPASTACRRAVGGGVRDRAHPRADPAHDPAAAGGAADAARRSSASSSCC